MSRCCAVGWTTSAPPQKSLSPVLRSSWLPLAQVLTSDFVPLFGDLRGRGGLATFIKPSMLSHLRRIPNCSEVPDSPPPPPTPRVLRPTVSWGGSWGPEPRGRPPTMLRPDLCDLPLSVRICVCVCVCVCVCICSLVRLRSKQAYIEEKSSLQVEQCNA